MPTTPSSRPYPLILPGYLLSIFYYMENFHWSMTESDQLSYILVTLRSSVEFLRGPDVNKWIPVAPCNTKPEHVSNTYILNSVPSNKIVMRKYGVSICLPVTKQHGPLICWSTKHETIIVCCLWDARILPSSSPSC